MVKATIIIPTYNRPNSLQRVLDYYHKHGKDFDIIVADSSSDENKKLNREIILSFPDLNMQYIDKYPKETDPSYKYADIMNYAKDKYCVFCDDDDFIIPSGIKDSVDFLEKNPDFTIAHGRYISFWLNPKKRGEKQFCWQVRYSNQSIAFSEPENRFFKQLSEYGLPTFHGVHRTDFLKMVHKELLDSKINLEVFGELLPSMLTLISGKMKCLDNVLYMARQIDSDRNYRNHWPTLTELINQGKYDEKYVKFRKCLVAHLHKKSQSDTEELKKLVDDAMSMYIKRYYSADPKGALLDKVKYILDSLHTPDWIYKKARLIYKRIRFPQQTDDFFVSLDNPSPSFKYYDDFNKIRSQVISHEQ